MYEKLKNRIAELEQKVQEQHSLDCHYQNEILSQIYHPVSITDKNHQFLYVNKAFCDMVQKKKHEIIGRHVSHVVPDKNFETFLKPKLEQCMETKEEINFVYDFPSDSINDEKKLLLTYQPYFTDDEIIKGVISTAKDITAEFESKKKNKETIRLLQEKNEDLQQLNEEYKTTIEELKKHRRIIDTASQGFALFDNKLRIVNANAALSKMTGYPKEKLIGKTPFDFISMEDAEMLKQNMEKTRLKHSQVYTIDLIRKDGSIIPVQVNVTRNYNKQKLLEEIFAFFTDLTAQKEAETELNKSRRELKKQLSFTRTLIQHLPIPLYYKDVNGRYLGCNPAFEKFTGKREKEIIYKTASQLWKSEYSEIYSKQDEYLVEHPVYNRYEFKVENARKEIRDVIFDKAVFYDGNMKPAGIIGVFTDITDSKKIQYELELRKEHYKSLSRSATEMLHLNDVDEIYEYISEAMQKQFAQVVTVFVTVDETISKARIKNIKGIKNKSLKRISQLSSGLLHKEFKLLPQNYEKYKTGKFTEFECGLKEFAGNELPPFISKSIETILNLNKIYAIGINKNGKLYAVLHFFSINDYQIEDSAYIESFVKQAGIVIERKIIEQKLQETLQELELITENVPNTIWKAEIDQSGNFTNTYISETINELLDLPPKTIQHDWYEYFNYVYPDYLPGIQDVFKEGMENPGKVLNFTYEVNKAGNKKAWFQSSGRVYFNDGIYEAYGFTTDVTEKIYAEQALKKRETELEQLNAMKDKLFSIISHDLRNPLSNVINFSELIKMNHEMYTVDKLLQYNDYIYQSASTISSLLDNLLTWSRSQRDKITIKAENISIRQIARDCIELLQTTAVNKNINLINSITEKLMVYADNEMTTTVIRNLLSNAIKFTYKNGTVSIVAKKIKNEVIISILDNGIGIAPDKLETLFQSYETGTGTGTDGEKGTGLGLIICKEFIEKNGGKIWVESEIDKGSAFHFSLPVKKN